MWSHVRSLLIEELIWLVLSGDIASPLDSTLLRRDLLVEGQKTHLLSLAQFLCNHRIYVVSDVGILELLIWIRLDLVPKLRSHLIFLTLHLLFFFQLFCYPWPAIAAQTETRLFLDMRKRN